MANLDGGRKKRGRFSDRIRDLLGEQPCRIQVAALPWRRGPDGVEVLLITSRERGRWVLPKGWPERDEPLWDAAAREAFEEAGIGGAVGSRQVGLYRYDKITASGGRKPCEVHVFPLEIDEVRDNWPERSQRVREWFSAPKAAALVDEADLALLIERFCANPRKILV